MTAASTDRWIAASVGAATLAALLSADLFSGAFPRSRVVDAGRLYALPVPASASMGGRDGVERTIDLRPQGDQDAPDGPDRIALAVRDRWGDEGVIADFLFAVRRSDGAVLVYDAPQRDAAVLLIAAYRVIVQNWRVDRAMEEMTRSGVRFTEVARRQLLQWLHRMRRRREAWLRMTDPEKVLVRNGAPPTPTAPLASAGGRR